jgi:hypothetical protein
MIFLLLIEPGDDLMLTQHVIVLLLRKKVILFMLTKICDFCLCDESR